MSGAASPSGSVGSTSVVQAALEALVSDHRGFDAHFKRLDVQASPKRPLLELRFLHPLFGRDGPDIDAFVENVYEALVPFCLPRSEIRRVVDRAMRDRDFRAIIRLGDRARELFVRTRGAALNGGEAGELILFLILEQIVRAPLLVSKMHLKTNANMNVHGRDAIHVRYAPDLKSLVLHLGESKLQSGFAGAIDDAINSIGGYLGDLALRRREIAIVNGHMDLDGIPAETEEQLRTMLDPYASPPPSYPVVHSCLIGFDYPAYSHGGVVGAEDVEKAFAERYAARAAEMCVQVEGKVDAGLPPATRLQFFVLPLPDLTAFRRTFAQRIGNARD